MPLTWSQVHLIAAREAERAFLDLGIDKSRRIDPFAALESAGVLVMRRPLDRLAGLYLPGDATGDGQPGVIVNVNHPPSKQRFTAAHELSHHLRDRQVVLDEETEWIARGEAPTSDRERIAEAFAAWFLMPKRLVNATISKAGLPLDRLSPEGAYGLALELGTSYTATIRHLVGMRLLSLKQRDALLGIAPHTIKRALGALDAVADAWRDVWLVRSPRLDLQLDVQEGDAVVVEVPEAPSSGYLWQSANVAAGPSLVRDEYHGPASPESLGGSGTHRFVFRVDSAGHQQVLLEMRRPWQRDVAPAEERRVEIVAEAKPAPGVVNVHALVRAGA